MHIDTRLGGCHCFLSSVTHPPFPLRTSKYLLIHLAGFIEVQIEDRIVAACLPTRCGVSHGRGFLCVGFIFHARYHMGTRDRGGPRASVDS